MGPKENAETRAPETTPGEPADYHECLYRVAEELRLVRAENDRLGGLLMQYEGFVYGDGLLPPQREADDGTE